MSNYLHEPDTGLVLRAVGGASATGRVARNRGSGRVSRGSATVERVVPDNYKMRINGINGELVGTDLYSLLGCLEGDLGRLDEFDACCPLVMEVSLYRR